MNLTLGFSLKPLCWQLLLATSMFACALPAFSQELDWQTDLEKSIQTAKRDNKLVLMHFTASWSKSCKELDTFVFTNSQVKRAIQTNVIPVRVDVDAHPELTAQYGVAKVPYDVVITPSRGVVLRRHSSPEAENYALAILRLEKTIQQIAETGSSRFDQNLDDFQQLMPQQANGGREEKDLTPQTPTHQAAPPSQHSQELFRKSNTSAVHNPLATAARPDFPATPEIADTTPRPVAPKPMRIVNPNVATSAENANSSQPLIAATMQPNLQRPPLHGQPELAKKTVESYPRQTNPTAQATEFRINEDLPSKPSAAFNADLNSAPVNEPNGQPVPPIALKGKCPITLIQEGRWQAGSKEWGCVHRDCTYLFVSEANLKTFLSNPDAYSPLLAGYDPVVFEETQKLVPGSIEHGVFMGAAPNLRVVLFRDQQSRAAFEAHPKKYLKVVQEAMENSGGETLAR